MQFTKEIREFVAQGGKVLIVENGEPTMVITPFKEKEYGKSVRTSSPAAASADFTQAAEEINRDIKTFVGDEFFTSFEMERQAADLPPGSGFYREPL